MIFPLDGHSYVGKLTADGDSTLQKVTCTSLVVNGVSQSNGATYNSVRPLCNIKDTTAAVATSKAFTGSTAVLNTSMWSSSTPGRILFPVAGFYSVTLTAYASATILTSLTINTTMTLVSGSTTQTINISSATLSASPVTMASTWSGYCSAGAYATFNSSSSLLSNWNTGGTYNNIQAFLIHWI
jgi:hypothetical protein